MAKENLEVLVPKTNYKSITGDEDVKFVLNNKDKQNVVTQKLIDQWVDRGKQLEDSQKNLEDAKKHVDQLQNIFHQNFGAVHAIENCIKALVVQERPEKETKKAENK